MASMKLNLDECIERVSRLELLGEDLVRPLCESLKEILVSESNVQHISAPVTVVGDVHGYAPLTVLLPTHGPFPADNSTTSSKCLKWAASAPTPTTSFSVPAPQQHRPFSLTVS